MNDCINLDGLKEIAEGDNDFFLEMLNLAKEQITESVEICDEYLQNPTLNSLENLGKNLHKTRPSFQQIGAGRLFNLSLELEKSIKENNFESAKVQDLALQYYNELLRVQSALNEVN